MGYHFFTCVDMHMHVMAYVQRSEESLQESVPTFHSEIRGRNSRCQVCAESAVRSWAISLSQGVLLGSCHVALASLGFVMFQAGLILVVDPPVNPFQPGYMGPRMEKHPIK